MHLSHPLSVTLGQVIVDGDDVHTAALQGIQIRRRRGNKRLTFTGLHLGNTTLMKNNTADQLHPVMLHAKDTLCCFADSRKGLHKQIIQGLSICKTLLVLCCFCPKLLIRKRLHLRTKRLNLIYQRFDSF